MPLPEELIKSTKEKIEKAKALLKEMKPELERMKRAGIDVTDDTKKFKETEEAIRLLELEYLKKPVI